MFFEHSNMFRTKIEFIYDKPSLYVNHLISRSFLSKFIFIIRLNNNLMRYRSNKLLSLEVQLTKYIGSSLRCKRTLANFFVLLLTHTTFWQTTFVACHNESQQLPRDRAASVLALALLLVLVFG